MTPDEQDDLIALELLRSQIQEDPEFKRATDRTRKLMDRADPQSPRVRMPRLTASHVRGEQMIQAAVLTWPVAAFSPMGLLAKAFTRGLPETRVRLMFAAAVRDAVPYLWKDDLFLLADSMPLPRHVIGTDLFPHDTMYWTLDNSVRLLNVENGWRDVDIQAFLVQRVADGYLFALFAEAIWEGRGRMVCSFDMVKMGTRYPEDTSAITATFLKMAAFINSPFIAVDKHRRTVPAKERRRYGPRIGDPMAVNVVTLRAEVREAVRVERGEGPKWKQRWLVRGHYRAQWYPSTWTHKVIWIAPYLKGPEDAPFKQPVYAVVR